MGTLSHICAHCGKAVGDGLLTPFKPTVGDALFCGRCGEVCYVVGKTSTRKPTFEETAAMLAKPTYQAARAAFVAGTRAAHIHGPGIYVLTSFEAIEKALAGRGPTNPHVLMVVQSAYARGLRDAFAMCRKIANNDELDEDEAIAATTLLENVINELFAKTFKSVMNESLRRDTNAPSL